MPVTPEERRRIRLEAFADIERELYKTGRQHIMDEVRSLITIHEERASQSGEEFAKEHLAALDASNVAAWRAWAEESVRELGLNPQPNGTRDRALRMELTRALVLGPPEANTDQKF